MAREIMMVEVQSIEHAGNLCWGETSYVGGRVGLLVHD